ncbi:MAG: PHP domain-containing protein [Alistipes sp.]|nr:PHP domain-containing protein [Alistipes sp.]
MRRLLSLIVLMLTIFLANAQFYTTQNREAAIRFFNKPSDRREIILPTIDGYNLYKADLHTHTIYSDGDVTPRQRVREAWYDGLDIVAITDHLEIRTYEKFMLKVLEPYNKSSKPFKYEHAGIANKTDKSTPVLANLNAAYDEAIYYAEREKLPIMVIRGTEIWRDTETIGEFNALFLKDINAVCHADLFESFRRVKEQGGLIMHNHPGYTRNTTAIEGVEQARAYNEGWIDGIEIVNSTTLYPATISRCLEKGLFMAANTDAHTPTAHIWGADKDFFRTMTFILAKSCSENDIKEALKAGRTIGYTANNLMGSEQLLTAFINEALLCRIVAENKKKDERTYCLTNNCSVPFILHRGGSIYHLKPFSTLRFTFTGGELPKFTVDNMWHADEQHPTVEITLDK